MSYAVAIERSAVGVLYDVRGPRERIEPAIASLGIALPARPNTRAAHGGAEIFWVGPERWLLRSSADRDPGGALAALDRSLSTSALEVGDAYAMFAIAGPDSATILAQASPLDVHAAAFPANGASFTEFFGQTALVARQGDGFVVLVEASYADYIERFLLRARG